MIIPIYKTGDDIKAIIAGADEVFKVLKQAGIRVHLDDRDKKNPGEKYNEWELKGVPLRLEFGPKDLANKAVMCCKRHDNEKR